MVRKTQWIHRITLSVLMLGSTLAAPVLGADPAKGATPVKADDCNTACSMFVDCTGEIIKREPTADEKNTLLQGCLKTCNDKKHQKGIMMCYAQAKKSKNSCTTYHSCVQSSASK